MQKFLLSLFAILITFISPCLAVGFPNKDNMDCVTWVYGSTTGTAITYYYAPSLTTLSPQGKLETWIKMVEKNADGTIDEVEIGHTFVDPSFDRYKETENIKYTSSGRLNVDEDFSSLVDDWSEMPDGTPYEDVLQAAWKYAKANQ